MKPALLFIKHLAFLFIMTFAVLFAKANPILSNGTSGNWSSTSTWVGGIVPGSTDAVTIASGDNVHIDVANAACASLNINTGTANTTSIITFNSGSILTVTGIVTIGGTGNAKGSIDMTSGGTFAVQQFTISKAGTWAAGTGTVQFTATNTLPTTFFNTFYNLTISAGTTSNAVAITVNGNLSIADAAAFTAGAFALTVTGTTTIGAGVSGTLNITSATGAKIFVGLITVNTGATWNNSANSAVTIRGGITNSGTFTAGTGNHTFNTNAQALNGTFSMSTVTVTGVTLTNNNTLTVLTALSGVGGTLIQASNAILNIGGTSGIATLTATNTGNIVNYTGAGQTVKGTNYYYLNLGGSGTKTLAVGMTSIAADLTLSGSVKATTVVGLTITGNLSVGDGTTFTAAGYALTVSGTTTVGAGTSGTLNVSSATAVKTFVGLVTIKSGGAWTSTGNSAISFQHGIAYSGSTFTSGSGVYTFDTNDQSIIGTIAITSIAVNGVNLTNNNTLTVATALSGSGAFIQASNAILNLKGTSTITTLTATATGNTVNYTGVSQNIFGTNYYHLTLSGSGTAVLSTATTTISGNLSFSGSVKTTTVVDLAISGNLSVGDGTTFTAAGFALAVAGTTTIGSGTSGVFNVTGSAGTKTFAGLIRINTNGKWVNTGNSDITLQNGISYSGSTFTGGNGVYTFDTNDQSLLGTVIIPNVTVNGINLTNNNTLTVSTALAGTGTLIQASNATLNIGGTLTIATLTVTNAGNTVGYTGTAQTVRAINYYNLTLGGSGIKTLQTGTTTITGNFTTSGSANTTAVVGLTIGGDVVLGSSSIFNAGSFTYNIGGNWQFNAGTFTRGTSTFIFNNSSTAQTIGGAKATAFTNLTIDNSNGVSLNDGTHSFNKTVNGTLTLTSGLLTTTSSNLLVLASGGTVSATTPDPVGNPTYYNASSYVDGPMQATITGTTGLTFPIGKSGTGYVPVSISKLFGTSPAPQTFTAEYFHVSAQTMGPIDIGNPQLDHVSGCDYLRLDLGATYPTSTNSSLPNGVTANITMFWNPNNGCSSSYVTNTSDLVIAHLNFMTGYSYSGRWTAIGGGYNYTGSTTNGSISYVGATTFSPFALGTISGSQNPLDIKLDYFTAVKAGTSNKISWKAECSSSSNVFEAQRSTDGINFTTIDTVRVDAQSDCSKGFVYNDYSIADSKIYYRIKTTDIEGVVGYSEVKLISNQSSTFEFIAVAPNPVRGNATLSITSAADEKIDISILSIDGRELQHKSVQLQTGITNLNLQTADLPKGMYFVKGIFPSGQVNTLKFIKE